MTRKELEDAVAAALLDGKRDFYVSQTVAEAYESAIVAIDTLLPLVTEAIYHAITDVAFEVFVDTDGHRSIAVHPEHDGMTEAAKIAKAWRPGPPTPMRVMERIYDEGNE